MDSTQFESVEAFWQSLKFEEDEREEIAVHKVVTKSRPEFPNKRKYRTALLLAV